MSTNKACVFGPYLDIRKYHFLMHELMTCENINKRGSTNTWPWNAIKAFYNDKQEMSLKKIIGFTVKNCYCALCILHTEISKNLKIGRLIMIFS